MAPLIFALNVHCDSCARKIRKAVKKVLGVDGVTASVETGLVMVDGNADAAALRAVIQAKSGSTVTIVSDGAEVGATAAGSGGSGTVTSWSPTPEPASPAAASIVLEMDLHCRSCAKKVEKRVMKIPGVETVTTDVQTGRVEVTGTADASTVARRIETSTSMVPRIVRDNPEAASSRRASGAGYDYDSPAAAPGGMSWYGGQQMYGQQWTAPAYPPPVGNYYSSGQGGEAYGYGGQQWGAPLPPPVDNYYSSGQGGGAYGYGGGEQWGAPPVGNYYSSGKGEAYGYSGEQWAAPPLENDEPSCVVQ